MSEETLPGGNMDGAVLIGGVVHKQASPWTPTVHALLRHLEQAGVDGVPRALGFDEQGRQMLTYLPGEMIGDRDPWPAWVYADSTLVQVGQWIRRVHDATADFTPPEGERWFIDRRMRPGWIVGHQDAAPYNAVMDGDRLAGFFDWDIASPSPREDDLGYSALLWVPLTAPEAGEQSSLGRRQGTVPPPSSAARYLPLRRRPPGLRRGNRRACPPAGRRHPQHG